MQGSSERGALSQYLLPQALFGFTSKVQCQEFRNARTQGRVTGGALIPGNGANLLLGQPQ